MKRGRESEIAEMSGGAVTDNVWLKKLQEQVEAEVIEVNSDKEMTNRVQKKTLEAEADDSVHVTESIPSSSSTSSSAVQEINYLLAHMNLEPVECFVLEFFC